MICFVVAMNREAENFINCIENKAVSSLCGRTVYEGEFCGESVALIVSGIGKVNASVSTQAVIDRFKPDCVINFGTAGGANESVSALSYYAVEKCCQYDFDLSELDNVSVGFMQDFNTLYFPLELDGLSFLDKKVLGSADRFSNKKETISLVRSLACDMRDMEGAAIAQTCRMNGVPLKMIKGITDTYDHPAKQFYENLTAVCKGFPDVIKTMLCIK